MSNIDIGDQALNDYMDRFSREQESWEEQLEERRNSDGWVQLPNATGNLLEDYQDTDHMDSCSHDFVEYDEKHFNEDTQEWEDCEDYE